MNFSFDYLKQAFFIMQTSSERNRDPVQTDLFKSGTFKFGPGWREKVKALRTKGSFRTRDSATRVQRGKLLPSAVHSGYSTR